MKKLMFAMNCLIVVFFNAYRLNAAWHIEKVDSGDYNTGTNSSLALDSADKVHISYRSKDNYNELYYLKYANNKSGTWEIESIATAGRYYYEGPPPTTSLAIDSNDKIHIGHDGKYTTNTTGSWITEAAPVGPCGNSLDLDSLGKAHMIGISFYLLGNPGDFEYATNASGTWIVEPVGEVNVYSSLALDSNNKVYISYGHIPYGLRYTTNVSGYWTTGEVESSALFYSEHSLAMDSADKLHLAYFREGLKHATNASGSWVIETVSSDGGGQCKLSIDSSNKAHIIYLSNGALKYATNAMGSWMIETVDSDCGPYGSSEFPSDIGLALDSSNRPHISYYWKDREFGFGGLKYARQFFDKDSDGDCPIIKIYGNKSDETIRLRRFRDNVLSQIPEGRELIKLYYQWIPVIIKAMEEDEAFKGEVKEVVDSVLPGIERELE